MDWLLFLGGILCGVQLGYAICMWFVVMPAQKAMQKVWDSCRPIQTVQEDWEVANEDWAIQEEDYF